MTHQVLMLTIEYTKYRMVEIKDIMVTENRQVTTAAIAKIVNITISVSSTSVGL